MEGTSALLFRKDEGLRGAHLDAACSALLCDMGRLAGLWAFSRSHQPPQGALDDIQRRAANLPV